MKKILALVLAMALAASTFVACGNDTGGDGGEVAYPGTADADMVTVDLGTEPPQMFSVLTTDSTSGNVLRQVMENLVILDQNNNVVAGVAETWEYDEETLTYTFTIREDAKWSNGDPVTADDFVFAWRALVNPAFAAGYAEFGYLFKNGKAVHEGTMGPEALGVEAVDAKTLTVTLENPTPYALEQLTFYCYLPVNEAFYETVGDTYGTEADKMLYNGPYVITEWIHEDSIVLEKNAEYYAFDDIAIPKVKMTMFTDRNTALNEFKAGNLDVMLLAGEQPKMMEDEGWPVITYDTGAVWYFEFNTVRDGLDNVNIRKALTMGVDAQGFIDNIKMNNSTVATSFTPSSIGIAGLADVRFSDMVGDVVTRDFEEAKKLLEKGLEEEGLTLETFTPSMVCDDTDSAQKYAAYFQEQWKVNLGVNVNINAMPFKSRIAAMQSYDFDIVLAGWAPDYNDPNTYLDIFTTGNGNNHTGYASAEFDGHLKAAALETDPEARAELLKLAELQLLEDMPIGPIYFDTRDYITSAKIKGVHRGLFQDINLRWATIA